MDRDEWRWKGGLWDFIEIVQWAFVFQRLGQERPDCLSDIITSPRQVRATADEYGMTYRAIAREMVRCGNDAMKLLDIIEARRAGENISDPDNDAVHDQEGCNYVD